MQKEDIKYDILFSPGLDTEKIKKISLEKGEPRWLLDFRLSSFEIFKKQQFPFWGPNLKRLDLEKINFFAKTNIENEKKSWEKLPKQIKDTFDKLGIPEAEKKILAGVGAQFDSEAVYHSINAETKQKGVIFEDLDSAIKKYPELVKKYFGKAVTPSEHKFSGLHYSVFSSGTFLYIPKGVIVDEPLQSYFRMNTKSFGQFEHTIIVLEDEAQAHYIEGCSAPKYNTPSLHAGCVEIFVGKGAKMRYSSIENWSTNTYNLNTKRAILQKNAFIEWVSGQLGSKTTMLYPCSVLLGDNSACEHYSFAVAGKGQNQDNGAKAIHIGKNTSSKIFSKSISKNNGVSTYRGLVDIKENALNSKAFVDCDSLILDEKSSADSIPIMKVGNSNSSVGHEAKTGQISQEKVFYLTQKGLSEEKAKSMIINGFLSPITKKLPLEYASELNILIENDFPNL